MQLYLEQEKEDKKLFFVKRNGHRIQIEHFDIVSGDIIEIKPGDNVSVDGIILSGMLKIFIIFL